MSGLKIVKVWIIDTSDANHTSQYILFEIYRCAMDVLSRMKSSGKC